MELAEEEEPEMDNTIDQNVMRGNKGEGSSKSEREGTWVRFHIYKPEEMG